MPINKQLKRTHLLNSVHTALLCLCCLTSACVNVTENTHNKQIANSPNIAYLRLTQGYWQVWLTDASGKIHQQLTHEKTDITRISWSADNSRLLCNQNNGRLVMIDIAQKHVIPLELSVKGMFDAQWSVDGKQIAFSLNSSQNADNNDIWITSTKNPQPQKLTYKTGIAQSPAWHPDGQSIIYSLARPQKNYELWQLNINTGSNQQLSVGHGNKFEPSFNHQGELAYASNSHGNYDIWRINKTNGRVEAVTTHPAYDAQPSWSADGKHIAFYSLRDDKRRIWIKNLSTGKLWSITPDNEQSRFPQWSR